MRYFFFALMLICFAPITTLGQAWQPLFDGISFSGWQNGKGEPVSGKAWEVVDGMLHLDRTRGSGGNLLTVREFGDFELVFEWKVAPKANNGIKYRVRDFNGATLGLEYQVIDDFGRPQLAADHKTASIYDIVDAKTHEVLRPAGEFNRGRILVRQNRIEHWLNGHLIASTNVGSEKWRQDISNSKFSDVEGFGLNQLGRIMLTDHSDEVWYRNIFIREFGPDTDSSTATASVSATGVGVSSTGCCCPQRRKWLWRLFRH